MAGTNRAQQMVHLDAPQNLATTAKWQSQADALALSAAGASTGGPIGSALVFHGSSASFDAVTPHPSWRGVAGSPPEWEGSAIFASPDPRVALFYSYTREKGYSGGIDLRSPFPEAGQPIAFSLSGGKDLNDALDHLYGRLSDSESQVGYIYTLDGNKFNWEKGLGQREVVCRDEAANLDKVQIQRRSEVERLVERGDIQLSWQPQ